MKRLGVLALASVTALATTSAALAEPRISSVVDVKPDFVLTPQEKESMSLSAGQLLIHVDRARDALHTNNTTQAKQEVEKALTLAKILKSALPTFTVKTQVKSGSLQYQDEGKVQPPLVTLHEELNTVAILKPIRIAKKEAEKKEAVAQGRPVAADIELRERRAQLNINLALAGLEATEKAINDNKLDIAERALTAVQTGVVFEYVVADLPLERARVNLFLAKQAAKQKNTQEARTALTIAADALDEYEKLAGTNHAKEIAEVKKEIEAITRSEQSQQTLSEEAIDKWWQKIASWAE